MEGSCRVWMGATQNLCMNSFLYHRYTADKNLDLKIWWGCALQHSKGVSPCKAENRLQKLTTIDQYDGTLFSAEEGIEYHALAEGFSKYIVTARDARSTCRNFFVSLAQIEIKEAHKHRWLRRLWMWAWPGPATSAIFFVEIAFEDMIQFMNYIIWSLRMLKCARKSVGPIAYTMWTYNARFISDTAFNDQNFIYEWIHKPIYINT